MILDEAINHAEEVAEGHEKIKCIKAVTLEECKCADEHRQLADWLKDYKRLKEQEPKMLSEIDHLHKYISKLETQIVEQEPCEDAIRKYQKIVKIIRNYDVTWEFHHMKHTIDEIREVIEDGNDI